jgi:hypothetical protein
MAAWEERVVTLADAALDAVLQLAVGVLNRRLRVLLVSHTEGAHLAVRVEEGRPDDVLAVLAHAQLAGGLDE